MLGRAAANPKVASLSLSPLFGLALIAVPPFQEINPNSDSQRKSYYILTNEPTSLKTFEDFIQSLPDSGTGVRSDQNTYPSIDSQIYLTSLTEDEATVVELHPIVYVSGWRTDSGQESPWDDSFTDDSFADDGFADDGFAGSNSSHRRSAKEAREDRPSALINIFERVPSELAVQMLSQTSRPPRRDIPYLFDPSLGAGSTIFVIDSGFNLRQSVRTMHFT
jgi:hypothetical protein